MPDDDLVQVTDAVVSTVSGQLPDMTDEQVQAVLHALNHVRAGDPLGTVRYDAETRKLAHRAILDGVHVWLVTAQDGERYIDHNPTLPWVVIREAVQP